MLGLGNSLSGGAALEGVFTPESISNIALWLKWNTNITSDLNSGGSSIDHSTAAGNMANGDQINAWNAAGDTSINAVQTTNSDKPRWSTESGEVGGAKSPNGNKHFDLSASVTGMSQFTLAGSAGSRACIKLNGGQMLILGIASFADIFLIGSASNQYVNVAYFK